MLLERGGAAIGARGSFDRTSLDWATVREIPQVVRLSLEHGADVSVCDEWGY